jgi:site-specific DNA recombinase
LQIVEALKMHATRPDRVRAALGHTAAAADELRDGPPDRQRQLVSDLLHRITLHTNSIRVEIKRSGLAALLAEKDVRAVACAEGLFDHTVPIQLARRGIETKLVMLAPGDRTSPPDTKLVSVLADAYRWIDDLAQGRAASVRDLARRSNRDTSEVSRTLSLAFLAPDIVRAILEGRHPRDLTPHQLKRAALPVRWADQRRLLGFPATEPA